MDEDVKQTAELPAQRDGCFLAQLHHLPEFPFKANWRDGHWMDINIVDPTTIACWYVTQPDTRHPNIALL